MEGNLLCVGIDAEGVIAPGRVEKKDVNGCYSSDDKGDHKVKSEEAGKGGVVNRKTSPQPCN